MVFPAGFVADKVVGVLLGTSAGSLGAAAALVEVELGGIFSFRPTCSRSVFNPLAAFKALTLTPCCLAILVKFFTGFDLVDSAFGTSARLWLGGFSKAQASARSSVCHRARGDRHVNLLPRDELLGIEAGIGLGDIAHGDVLSLGDLHQRIVPGDGVSFVSAGGTISGGSIAGDGVTTGVDGTIAWYPLAGFVPGLDATVVGIVGSGRA